LIRALFASLLACVALDAAGANAHTTGYAARPEVREFVAEMVDKHGFSREELDRIFSAARPQRTILRAMLSPAESPQRSWLAYRALFVTPQRIEAGVRFRESNAGALARASASYGVPEEIVVAIIGIETVYGRNLGNYRVIDALATLAFDFPERRDFFRGELEQYLLYAREEGIQALALKGSYAGAIGIPQFMPGTYRRFAVDFDGDGRRDLSHSAADAIGSVANFLKEHGWQAGQPIAVPARVSGDAYRALIEEGIKPSVPVLALGAFGVSVAESLPPGSLCTVIELQTPGHAPEYRVGLDNFYALTRYNRSSLYALSVQELAHAIEQAYRASRPGSPD
jgi:membrane-bound lytic murein transglycosylase B